MRSVWLSITATVAASALYTFVVEPYLSRALTRDDGGPSGSPADHVNNEKRGVV